MTPGGAVDDGSRGLGDYGGTGANADPDWGVRDTGSVDDESWYEKWWVWTIIGAGVAAATALTVGVFYGQSTKLPETDLGSFQYQ